MPGGADLPFCKLLNGRGNDLIRRYVEGGGAYLGLCAGGYYGSSRCEFELGSALEVVGLRELGFFPGIARGAAFDGFEYATENGTRAAHLLLRAPPDDRRAASPTASGPPDPPPLEVCRVYVNGGCGFLAADGGPVEEGKPAGCDVLAWFADPEVAERIAQAGSPTRRAGGRVACAVQCAVGSGVAVLTGAHPELAVETLESDHTRMFGKEGGCIDSMVLGQLQAGEAGRRRFFESLLVALGL